MDVTTLLRRICRIANRRADRRPRKIICSLAIALLAAGCSQVSPEYDPINWIDSGTREVEGWFSDQPPPPAPIVQPPPAEGRPIPNLATVPPPPLVTPGEWAERRKQMAALEADRVAAAKADAALRGKTPPATAAPAQPSPAPAAAPAQASPSEAVPTEAAPAQPSPSVQEGAAPAPLNEVRSLPPRANAAPAAHLLTTSERHGAVSFGRDDASLSAAARNALDAAAASALTNDGRVRLVPVPIDGAAAPSGIVARRETSIREVLAGVGVPADRVTIVDPGSHRADAYNVFVDY